MEIVKEIKRGYVKWTDENGVFHKEPLVNDAQLLAAATPEQRLKAEEARRLNAAAETEEKAEDGSEEKEAEEALDALRKAPPEVLTVAQLVEDDDVTVQPTQELTPEHQAALAEFQAKTSG